MELMMICLYIHVYLLIFTHLSIQVRDDWIAAPKITDKQVEKSAASYVINGVLFLYLALSGSQNM